MNSKDKESFLIKNIGRPGSSKNLKHFLLHQNKKATDDKVFFVNERRNKTDD